MDPVRNPYAPGAGQRPPELAGRDTELSAFDVVLERIAHGRPERSLVLTGLRGVGKTVLLNQLRSAAIRRGWGTGKIEARPEQSLRRPVSSALHMALRELARGTATRSRSTRSSASLKAFAQRQTPADAEGARPLAARHRRARRHRPGRLRRHGDRPRRAAQRRRRRGRRHRQRHRAVHRRDAGRAARRRLGHLRRLPRALAAGRAADRRRRRAPPPAGGAVSASKSYSERLFRYLRIDRLDREAADRALLAPAEREDVEFEPAALDALYEAADGYPYFVQAYGKVTWDVAASSPITAADVAMAAPVAEAELAVGFFGSRYDRATPAEREYMHAMAELGGPSGAAVATSEVAVSLGRKPASLSPARDSLIKKGLVYSAERGQIAFTVPHFGRYLLRHPD